MHLKIITREGIKVSQDAKSVSLPACGGRMEVLDSHASSIVLLKKGRLRYDSHEIVVGAGVAKVYNNEVLLLVEGIMAGRG